MGRKTIGKILRGIEDKKSDKVSVINMIDTTLTDGSLSVGAFSIRFVRKKLAELQKQLEVEDFDRETFFIEFFKLYNAVMAPDMRARNVFHPSSLKEDCMRKLVLDLSKVAPTDKKMSTIPGSLQRIFDLGTWFHLYIQNILYTNGTLEQAEVPVINKERYLNGKADGVFFKHVFGKKVVLEIKTMNSWNYSKAVFKPFKKHEFQASLYGRELGAEAVLYLYINKDTCEMKEFLEPLNMEMLGEADRKMDKVIKHVDEGTLPPVTCSDRLCDNALACPFTSICFKK